MRVIPDYALYGDPTQAHWSSAFYFEWISWRTRKHHGVIKPHVHNAFVQLLYLDTGTVEVLADQTRTALAAPAVILVPAQTVHGFHFSDDADGPVVTADQRVLETLAQVAMPALVGFMRKPWSIPLELGSRHVPSILTLFDAIEREADFDAVGQEAVNMSLVIALLVQFARAGSRFEPVASPTSRKARTVERFRALLDARYREHLSVAAYADALGISAGQLSRICREVSGRSALDLVNRRAVYAAERELIYTTSSVKQVAASLGFADESYFSRFFRKQTGLTPLDFRTRALGDKQQAAENAARLSMERP